MMAIRWLLWVAMEATVFAVGYLLGKYTVPTLGLWPLLPLIALLSFAMVVIMDEEFDL